MDTPQRTTSTTAIVSLMFGVLSWFAIPFIGAIVAVVCGHVARGEIRRAPSNSIEGDGMALAGLILGYLNFVVILCVLLFATGLVEMLLTHGNWHAGIG